MGVAFLATVAALLVAASPGAQPTLPSLFVYAEPLAAPENRVALLEVTDLLKRELRKREVHVPDTRESTSLVVRVLGVRDRFAHSVQHGQSGVGRQIAPPRVVLLRLEVSSGGEPREMRIHEQAGTRADERLVSRAADQLVAWTADAATRPRVGGRPGPATGASLPVLLQRAGWYIDEYERKFATILADETYVQEFTERRLPYPTAATITRRHLRSEFGLAWFADVGGWFGFRDVIEVDGRRLPEREERLRTLFLDNPGGKLSKRVANESARFNLGTVRRNFNLPTTPLLFLSAERQERFQFDLEPAPEQVGDIQAAVVRYRETGSPTIILQNERDAPAQGHFWLDPSDGRVLRSEMIVGERTIEVRVQTWYREDARLEMLVPDRMREVYDYTGVVDDFIECVAKYGNFRRFVTGGKLLEFKSEAPPRR
jgi:hypothetical protein